MNVTPTYLLFSTRSQIQRTADCVIQNFLTVSQVMSSVLELWPSNDFHVSMPPQDHEPKCQAYNQSEHDTDKQELTKRLLRLCRDNWHRTISWLSGMSLSLDNKVLRQLAVFQAHPGQTVHLGIKEHLTLFQADPGRPVCLGIKQHLTVFQAHPCQTVHLCIKDHLTVFQAHLVEQCASVSRNTWWYFRHILVKQCALVSRNTDCVEKNQFKTSKHNQCSANMITNLESKHCKHKEIITKQPGSDTAHCVNVFATILWKCTETKSWRRSTKLTFTGKTSCSSSFSADFRNKCSLWSCWRRSCSWCRRSCCCWMFLRSFSSFFSLQFNSFSSAFSSCCHISTKLSHNQVVSLTD